MVDDPQKMLSELARLGARLIIQRAVEDEFETWLGRARYARRPEEVKTPRDRSDDDVRRSLSTNNSGPAPHGALDLFVDRSRTT
jgi:hypothetical protein